MIKRVVLLPYKIGSTSGKEIQQALQEEGYKCHRVKLDSRTFIPKRDTLYIYYGGTQRVQWPTPNVLNVNRNLATNKLSTLQRLQENEISTVPWTTDKDVAYSWCEAHPHKYDVAGMARTILSGHSGEGIVPFYHACEYSIEGAVFPTAPLYTKYVKKTYECRIHVFNGKVIDSQIKRKVRDVEEPNTYIRNIHTGWVYCREDFTPTDECKQIAIDAVAALNLDFGAVDIIYNKHYNKYYILEVNTAPGLTGTTLQNYVKEIINVCKAH